MPTDALTHEDHVRRFIEREFRADGHTAEEVTETWDDLVAHLYDGDEAQAHDAFIDDLITFADLYMRKGVAVKPNGEPACHDIYPSERQALMCTLRDGDHHLEDLLTESCFTFVHYKERVIVDANHLHHLQECDDEFELAKVGDTYWEDLKVTKSKLRITPDNMYFVEVD